MTENDEGRDSKTGRFLEGHQGMPGNQYGAIHGGEAGIEAVRHGRPFLEGSPAHAAELAVYEQLDEVGLPSYLESRAVQVEAVCDLFAGEIARAASTGNAELLDQRVKRWGWLRGVADRTWKLVEQIRQARGGGDDVLDYEKLLEAQRHGDTED